MIFRSRVNKRNKYKDPEKVGKELIYFYYCRIGDELELIRENFYQYKDGLFYNVRNIKTNDLFTIDKDEVEIVDDGFNFDFGI